tara:strand:- start:1781 stop:1927 length:147 start_codon:yes stop_codon:yes gene_type:complete
MAETNAPLARTTIYAHGILGLPLAVIGYPLAIWIPHIMREASVSAWPQ